VSGTDAEFLSMQRHCDSFIGPTMQFWRTLKELLLLVLQVFTGIYENEINTFHSNLRRRTISLHKDLVHFKGHFRSILYFRSVSDLITNENIHKVFQIKELTS
jgi:hypothetical protein